MFHQSSESGTCVKVEVMLYEIALTVGRDKENVFVTILI